MARVQLSADVWGRVLENAVGYDEQLRLSTVCKGWSVIIKSLPRLRIAIPKNPSAASAEVYLGEALHGRSNLRDLEVRTHGPSYRCVFKDEQEFFDALLQLVVWPSVATLTLYAKYLFLELTASGWSRINAGFPNLVCLTINVDTISAGPAADGLIFRNLKTLSIKTHKMHGAVLEELITACPLLEDCSANVVSGDVHVRSSSNLIHLEIMNKESGELTIEACNNLRSLNVHMLSPRVEAGLTNLRSLKMENCKDVRLPRLPSLKLFFVSPGSISELFVDNLKFLVIRLPAAFPPATLQMLVPPQLEVLYFSTHRSITADEVFHSKTDEELLEIMETELLETDLEQFPCLKKVVVKVVNGRGMEDLLLPLAVQVLRCSPQLEHLTLDLSLVYMPNVSMTDDTFDSLADLAKLDARVHLRFETPIISDIPADFIRNYK